MPDNTPCETSGDDFHINNLDYGLQKVPSIGKLNKALEPKTPKLRHSKSKDKNVLAEKKKVRRISLC